MKLTWPAALVLVVLTGCTTVLVWKGAVPSHAFTAVGGVIVGYLFRGSPLGPLGLSGRRGVEEVEAEPVKFSRDEIPTKPGKAEEKKP